MNLPLMLLTVPQAGQVIICVAGDYFCYRNRRHILQYFL